MHEPWRKGMIQNSDERRYSVRDPDGTEYQRNRVHIRPTEIRTGIRDISPPRVIDCGDETVVGDQVLSKSTEQSDKSSSHLWRGINISI